KEGTASPKLLAKLQALTADPSITVRYQLAFTWGEIKGPSKIAPLAAIAKRDLDSPWTQAAILSSLADGAGHLFSVLSGEPRVATTKPGQELLKQPVALVGAANRKDEVTRALDFIAAANPPALSFALMRALSDGLQRAGSSLTAAGADVKDIVARAS